MSFVSGYVCPGSMTQWRNSRKTLETHFLHSGFILSHYLHGQRFKENLIRKGSYVWAVERSLKINLVQNFELEVWSLARQILFWCLAARRLGIFLLCNWINTNSKPELLPGHNIGKQWSKFWISCEFASWKMCHLRSSTLQNCLVCAVHCSGFCKAASKRVNRGNSS